jgi:hypothetical protein
MDVADTSNQERLILESLDALLRMPSVRAAIEPVVDRVERQLGRDPSAVMAWEPLPLAIYRPSLPQFLQSSWVFILRAQTATGAERHPNSRQRMMSYRGTGDLQTGDVAAGDAPTGGPARWESHPLVSDATADLKKRWISIPVNVWHQCVVPEGNWVVVSFHMVPAEQLIEERPDSELAGQTKRKTYLG